MEFTQFTRLLCGQFSETSNNLGQILSKTKTFTNDISRYENNPNPSLVFTINSLQQKSNYIKYYFFPQKFNFYYLGDAWNIWNHSVV